MKKGTSSWLPPHHRFRGKIRFDNFAKPVGYLLLFVLSYTLGSYMSSNGSPYSGAAPPPPPLPPIIFTTASQDNNNNIVHGGHELLQEQENESDGGGGNDDVRFDDHNIFGTVCAAELVPDSKLARRIIIDRVFNGISPWINFPPSHVARLLRSTRVQGWGSTGAVFGNLIRRVKPKIIIEVGTFLGASALHMVQLTRQLGLRDVQILCVDDFRGWPGFQKDRWSRSDEIKMVNGDAMLLYQFMQNVVHANASESVMFMPFSTGSALEKLCEWGVFGDLIEIDAGHDFHSAWSDINRAYKILRPGGVLFGHDYLTAADNRGVRRAVNLFAKVKNLC